MEALSLSCNAMWGLMAVNVHIIHPPSPSACQQTSVQAKSLEADEPPVMVLPGTALAAGVTVRSLSTGAVGTSPKDLERLEVGQVEEEEEDSGLGQQAPQRTFSQHAIPVTVIGENPPPVEGMQFVSTPVDSEGTPILSFQPEGPLSPSHREG